MKRVVRCFTLRLVVLAAFLTLFLNPNYADACAEGGDVVVSGTLQTIVGTPVIGSASGPISYRVVHSDKELHGRRHFRLNTDLSALRQIPDGTKVSLRGHFDKSDPTGNTIHLNRVNGHADISVVEAANGTGSGTAISSGTVAGGVSGSDSVLVLRVSSGNGVPSCSPASLSSTLQTIGSWMSENSFGKFTFGPIAVYDVAINFTGTDCSSDYSTVASLANAASPVSVSNYAHVVYEFMDASCGWAGLGNLPGSQVWINGTYCGYPDIAFHELGHNKGMHHSGLDSNLDGILDSGTSGEYGDTSDPMGYGGVGYRHSNVPHKFQEGWSTVTTVAAPGGTYTIGAVEKASVASGLQITAVSGAPFYVGYRSATGTQYSANLGHSKLVEVHRYSGGASQTMLEAALGAGQSFVDPSSGLTISVPAIDAAADQATVSVAFQCVTNKPTMSLSPYLKGTNVSPGSYAYTVSVTNNDAAGCGSSSFNLAAAIPSGWSATFSSNALTVAAGGSSAQTTLTVNSPSGISQADYPVVVSAANPSHTYPTATAIARFDATAPLAPGTPTATTRKQGNKLIVSLAWGASSDNLGVSGYRVYKGSTLLSTVTGTSFSDTLTKAGSYVYSIKAEDFAGNVSPASNSVTVKK
ncbi:MAG: NEW3 domain-containing protein [Bdellovibrionota bacterium]